MAAGAGFEVGGDLRSASRSTTVLRNVEHAVAIAEHRLGRSVLLDAVEVLPSGYQADHVQHYRSIVRGRAWPNEDRPSSLASFLDEYEQAAIAFARVGVEALNYVLNGTPRELDLIYRRVEASEALRGQYGKRSPTGLDARLDHLERELGVLLESRLGADAFDVLNLLGTPIDPHVTAESALIEEFCLIRRMFPKPPSAKILARGNGAKTEALWVFLRRHARWSQVVLESYYDRFDGSVFDDHVRSCRARRHDFAERRATLVGELARSEPADWYEAVVQRSTELTILNHLNLSLEPCFSFKGGVGLGQGFVFLLAAQAGLEPTIDPTKLSTSKWQLLGEPDTPWIREAKASCMN